LNRNLIVADFGEDFFDAIREVLVAAVF